PAARSEAADTSSASVPPISDTTPEPAALLLATPPSPPASVVRPPNAPLVSCVMPTRRRADFVMQSIRYFQRQDYPERELLILDDADSEDLTGRIPADPRVRYLRLPPGQTIGAKRNQGCELARGSLIAQW